MTDRIHSITLVLEADLREDDAQSLLAAVRMLKGVISAAGNVSNITDYIAQARVRLEYGQQLLAIVYPNNTP